MNNGSFAEPNTVVRRASQGLLLLAVLLLIGHLVVYVYYAISLMRFPFDYDQGEGFELVDTIMFSEGEWPYRDNETYPFYASNYPPLFHVILVPFVWVFGEAYWYGRLAGFLGTLVTASTIGLIVQRVGRSRQIALLSGLAFLASNYIYHIGPLFRQHMTMVMFETLAIAVLAGVNEIEHTARRRWMLALGLLLVLAAGFTKQLALATALAVFVFLFLRNPRRCIAWGVIFAAVGGGVFLWINVATDGAWWTNIIAANVNDYLAGQYRALLGQWLRLHGVLIVLALLLVLYEIYFARLSLYSVWWVFTVANTTLAGKWGAGDSYFATAIAATCILSGIFMARTLRGEWSFPDSAYMRRISGVREALAARRDTVQRAAALLVPVVYLVYGLGVIKLPTEGAFFGPLTDTLGLESTYGGRYNFYDSAGEVAGYAAIGHIPTQRDIDNGERIVDIVRASDKPVMSEEAAFSLRADRDVITNPTQLKNLYENDLFDPANLIAAIQAQEFGAIIYRARFYPEPVLDAVDHAYYPVEIIHMNGFDYEIWRPDPLRELHAIVNNELDNLTPDAEQEIALVLPPDQAQQWITHRLDVLDWLPQANTVQQNGVCWQRDFTDGMHTILVVLCPADAGSTLTILELE